MPRRLPPLIKLLVSRTPRVYRAAVAHAVFPALGAHLWKTRFRYIDNVLHEATLMNVLVGETGAGKNCISEPINHILRDIRQRDMENLSFRANVIAYLKAMVLYVAHGERWDKTMEEFVRWSLHYDLWCKMHLFGEAIETQEEAGEKKKHKGPQNLLDLLPEVFTREEAGALRTRMGVRGGSLTHMLNNWKQRGYIELYGEEMTRSEAGRQRYIKTEEYLRRHPKRMVDG